MNNAIEGKSYLAEKRYKEGIGGISDMASHLILPAKLQNWGFEDNSKQNPRHWLETVSLICALLLWHSNE